MSPTPTPPPELPPAIAERIGFLSGKTHQLVIEMARGVLSEHGLTGKHFGCLTVLADEGPMSQQALAERFGLDRTTMVAVVDDLEERGMVTRGRNPADRRAYALEVTAEGRAWLRRVGRELPRAESELFSPLSEAERRRLIELLQKLVAGHLASRSRSPEG